MTAYGLLDRRRRVRRHRPEPPGDVRAPDRRTPSAALVDVLRRGGRCQVHKLRNVAEHLPKHRQAWVKATMRKAWRSGTVATARQRLTSLAEQLRATILHKSDLELGIGFSPIARRPSC